MHEDCNCAYLPYCDGASFSGFRAAPWPDEVAHPAPRMASRLTTPSNTLTAQRLTFRGLANLDAALDALVSQHGLGSTPATGGGAAGGAELEVVLTGDSAGGLATILHADRVRARVQRAMAAQPPPPPPPSPPPPSPQSSSPPSPPTTTLKFRAVPVVGAFLDHGNVRGDSQNYTAWTRSLVEAQNVTGSGALSPACLAAHGGQGGGLDDGGQSFRCFMAPHALPFVATPLFLVNSKFDSWQLNNELQARCLLANDYPCEGAERAGVLQYGADWLAAFPRQALLAGGHGAFVTSCVCHGCPWATLTAGAGANLTAWQAVAAWYSGETVGDANLHIDARGPNGDGSIPASRSCLLVQTCCIDVL